MKLELYPFDNNVLLIPNLLEYEQSNDSYLTEDVFISFVERLYTLLSSNNLTSICLQPMSPFQSILETFIHVDLTNMTVRVPHKSFNYINEICPSISMIVFPIKIHLVNIQDSYLEHDKYNFDLNDTDLHYIDQLLQSLTLTTAHSNLLLIDNHNKTIEYFEPHGITLSHTSSSIVSLERIIYKTVLKFFPFVSSYSFTNASNSCIIGVQTIQSLVDNKVGHCLAWSLFFLLMRLFNNKLVLYGESISEFIHRFLVSLPAVQLDDIVRRFITYVQTNSHKTDKHYSNYLTFDINASLSRKEKSTIEERLSVISDIYIKKLINSSEQDMAILFTEIISYRNLPNFHQIMSRSVRKIISNEQTNNQKYIDDMLSVFTNIED